MSVEDLFDKYILAVIIFLYSILWGYWLFFQSFRLMKSSEICLSRALRSGTDMGKLISGSTHWRIGRRRLVRVKHYILLGPSACCCSYPALTVCIWGRSIYSETGPGIWARAPARKTGVLPCAACFPFASVSDVLLQMISNVITVFPPPPRRTWLWFANSRGELRGEKAGSFGDLETLNFVI